MLIFLSKSLVLPFNICGDTNNPSPFQDQSITTLALPPLLPLWLASSLPPLSPVLDEMCKRVWIPLLAHGQLTSLAKVSFSPSVDMTCKYPLNLGWVLRSPSSSWDRILPGLILSRSCAGNNRCYKLKSHQSSHARRIFTDLLPAFWLLNFLYVFGHVLWALSGERLMYEQEMSGFIFIT